MDIKTGKNINMNKITLNLALPAIAEMLLQTLMGIADTAMVGTLGYAAIAAVGLSDNPMMVMMAFFAAISVGTTALVARFTGANNHSDAMKTIKQSLYMSILFSIIFTAVMMTISKNIVVMMGAEKSLVPLANSYLAIALIGLPGMIISMIMSGALRGTGDTKTPMLVNGFSNILNIVGNFFLIFPTRILSLPIPLLDYSFSFKMIGAGYGVTGAAIATTLSRIVAALFMLYYVIDKNGKYQIKLFENIKIDKSLIGRILKIGLPAAAEQMLLRFAQLTYFRIIAQLGTTSIAVFKISMTAESLSFMPGWGFALASTTLVGQYLGSEDPENARKGCLTANKMATIVMTIFGLLFFFTPRTFILIFTRDEEIIRIAAVCLRIIALSQPLLASTMVFSGGLRGAGDTKTVLWVTALSSWIIRVGLGYILTFTAGMGMPGAFIAMALDLSVRGVIFAYIFNKGNWKNIKV